jgi:hypothetical protein
MLLVHLEHPSPRARYIVRHLFERMLGWPVTFVGSREEVRSASGPRLVHGTTEEEGCFHVPDSGWLRLSGLDVPAPPPRLEGGRLSLFERGGKEDVFASAFFFLSGLDEWTTTARDRFGRVPADALFVVRHGLEGTPWVDRWALELAEALRTQYPALPPPARRYRHVLTVDVDNALKYQGRSWHRAMGASLKEAARGRLSAVRERWQVRSGTVRDPYAVLPEVLQQVEGKADRTIAFFLMRSEGAFDHAADMRHPKVRALVQATARRAEAGLHPSFHSSEDDALIVHERQALTDIVGRPVRCTRQHFLRWRMPGTFRTLAAQGFQEEHSFGFSDRTGLRFGTCTPFPWYDLEHDEETELMCWPFAAMDSALADHARLDPHAAARAMAAMVDRVRAVQGTFISVWHDRFLSGHDAFAGWPAAFHQVMEHAHA